MPDFIRARSSAQKEQRMAEIKQAADELFHEKSYHEITLKGISERLGWSHAALYKYVSTKEDIFLELCADARGEYVSSLLAAYPNGCAYSHEVLARSGPSSSTATATTSPTVTFCSPSSRQT